MTNIVGTRATFFCFFWSQEPWSRFKALRGEFDVMSDITGYLPLATPCPEYGVLRAKETDLPDDFACLSAEFFSFYCGLHWDEVLELAIVVYRFIFFVGLFLALSGECMKLILSRYWSNRNDVASIDAGLYLRMTSPIYRFLPRVTHTLAAQALVHNLTVSVVSWALWGYRIDRMNVYNGYLASDCITGRTL